MNNRLRDYICNRNMDKIRNTFKKYFSASGLELPDDISPYGELSSKDGWHLIYSLAEDCDMNPLLKFEASHRMTNTRYISIDSSAWILTKPILLRYGCPGSETMPIISAKILGNTTRITHFLGKIPPLSPNGIKAISGHWA